MDQFIPVPGITNLVVNGDCAREQAKILLKLEKMLEKPIEGLVDPTPEEVAISNKPKYEPFVCKGQIQTNLAFWKTVVRWDVPKGGYGQLIEVQMSGETGTEWRMKIGVNLNSRDPKCKIIPLQGNTSFSGLHLGGGEGVILQVRSPDTKTMVTGIIMGSVGMNPGVQLADVDIAGKMTPSPRVIKPSPPVEEPEVKIRSLGDIFQELESTGIKSEETGIDVSEGVALGRVIKKKATITSPRPNTGYIPATTKAHAWSKTNNQPSGFAAFTIGGLEYKVPFYD